MTIINRSNYSYHFLLSFQFCMSLFVCCLVGLFLVWALFQPNKAVGMRHVGGPVLKSQPVTTNKGSLSSKRNCHSAVCFRPCLRPDDRDRLSLHYPGTRQWGKKEKNGVLHRCPFIRDIYITVLVPVVQLFYSIIHRINHFPVDKYYGCQLGYPLDKDLSIG